MSGGGEEALEVLPARPPSRAGRKGKFREAPAGTKQMTHFFSKEQGGGGREAENGARKRVSPGPGPAPAAAAPAAAGERGQRKRLRILESDEEDEENVVAEEGGGAPEAPRALPLEAQ